MSEPIWLDKETFLYGLFDVPPQRLILRDKGLLDSALNRPRDFYYYNVECSLSSLAALYAEAIIRNHPFVDGNKRASFCAMIQFLEINGFDFAADEGERIELFLKLAGREIEPNEFYIWVDKNMVKIT